MPDPQSRLTAALADRYRIERQLGQGGMATVYLAEDTKHRRKVALKVLKPELAAVLGAERFVQEINTTASLQHPHILPLFDSGTAGGFLYYVMPFIDGETLRDRLNRETQLDVEDAVRITTDVADALQYAHEHGVIHRDIKPENILLANGRPMVADFGIALAVSAAAGGRMTETGLSLGTPHYMSPEQATAEKDISARSDIYSLASVLYEMLAGEPPHGGGSAQAIIMKIIAEPAPAVTRYRRSVPPNVAAAVMKALEKVPADRFASARAFAEALRNPAYAAAAATASGSPAPVAAGWRHRTAVPALGLAGLFALTSAWALTRRGEEPRLARYQVALPEGKRLGNTQWSPMAVSPDGSKLVYGGESGRLVVRSRDQLDPVELVGTEGAFNPFFSPDGTRIGFMSGVAGRAELRFVLLTGGPPVPVTSTGVGGPGASWGHDGYIYFDASGVGPLRRVRETGGTPETVSTLDSLGGELQHDWPDALPNGRGVLVTVNRGGPGINVSGLDDIAVVDLATGKHRVLVHGIFARYAASGHLLYVTAERTLMAVPFDQDRLEVTGDPIALIEGINVRTGGGGVDLAISRVGTLWYTTGTVRGDREVFWVSRSGVFSAVDPDWRGDFGSLALSPEGKRLAVSVVEASGQTIWVKQVDRAGGAFTKLTHEGLSRGPRWHPDGQQILFQRRVASEGSALASVRADGSGSPTVVRDDRYITDGSWSRDGVWLVFIGRSPTFKVFRDDVYAYRPGVDSTPVPVVASDYSEIEASVSPNGRWLLYSSNTSGLYEAYVRPFPNTSASQVQVTNVGGMSPKWSVDGSEIIFRSNTAELMRVAVLPGTEFAVGPPSRLFSLTDVVDWDVTRDPNRFVAIRTRASSTESRLVVVENFFEELRRKTPR